MTSKNEPPEPNDVLYRIKRGLAGYISYLAACEMNVAFSECYRAPQGITANHSGHDGASGRAATQRDQGSS
jgi:hypothetical protein